MDRLGFEQCTDFSQRPMMIIEVLPLHRDIAGGRYVEAHDHSHRRRLTRTVRSEEARDDPGSNREAQFLDSVFRAVVLRQSNCVDHRTSPIVAATVADTLKPRTVTGPTNRYE